MIGWFVVVLVVVALAAGVFCLVMGFIGKIPGDPTLGSIALLELLLLVQLVMAIVAPFAGNKPTGSLLEFYIYLVAALIIPVAAAIYALIERDRWSTVVLGVAALAIAVMVYRMDIIWTVQIA